MTPFGSIEDRHGVDDPDYQPPSDNDAVVPAPEEPVKRPKPRYAIAKQQPASPLSAARQRSSPPSFPSMNQGTASGTWPPTPSCKTENG